MRVSDIILESLNTRKSEIINESKTGEFVSKLEQDILKKYPKLARCNLKVYDDSEYSGNLEIFLGGKTNIIGCDSLKVKKLMKESDPLKVCIDALKAKVDSVKDDPKKQALVKKFYDGLGKKIEIQATEKKTKVRINSYDTLMKYVGKTYGGILDDFGTGFSIEYAKGARSFRTDLKKKLIEMGYNVTLSKGVIEIEISKKGTLLSVNIYDDTEQDNGVVLEPTIVW